MYPLAFVVLAYAYLGAPRTTRQSRTMSLLGAIGAVAVLRMVGFASAVFAVHVPAAILAQYLSLVIAVGFGLWAIGRSVVIEPPAFLLNAINAVAARVMPREATS
jgi:lipopolysaccharide export system permease protein